MFDAIPLAYQAAIAIIIGFVGLIWSADRFVGGAAAIAKGFGITPMIIGLTIVSLGTSAPEILVSINASLTGAGDLAVGNALGSNIANIGLVLAATALVAKIPVQGHILKDEMPVLILVTAASGMILYDAKISALEGWFLLVALVPAMVYLVYRKRGDLSPQELAEQQEDIPDMTCRVAWIWFAIGLALLIISAKILVWGGENAATMLGVSPLIIGLTVIAIGTSLPELAASIASAVKGHHDIALGNIVGSNIFNLLAVMSLPGIMASPRMGADVFQRDYTAMALLTLLLVAVVAIPLARQKLGASATLKAEIGRFAGLIILAGYILYYWVLFNGSH